MPSLSWRATPRAILVTLVEAATPSLLVSRIGRVRNGLLDLRLGDLLAMAALDRALAAVVQVGLDVDARLILTHDPVAVGALDFGQRAHDGQAERLEAVPAKGVAPKRQDPQRQALRHNTNGAASAKSYWLSRSRDPKGPQGGAVARETLSPRRSEPRQRRRTGGRA